MSSSRFGRGTGSRGLGIVALVALVHAGAPVPAQDPLVPAGSEWQFFRGTEEPPAEWKDLSFDDSAWETGATPIGYGDAGVLGIAAYPTPLADMQNSYYSCYMRHKFVANPSEIKLLKLQAKYDDGFIAYLNGTEIARSVSMPVGPVTFNTPSGDHETNAAFQDFVVACDVTTSALLDGDNVLAVQGHNVNLTSSDFTVEIQLDVVSLPSFCPESMTTRELSNNRVQVTWKKPTGLPTAQMYDTLTLTRNGEELTLANTGVTSYIDRTPAAGNNEYVLDATLCGETCRLEASIVIGPVGTPFRRGDANGDGSANLSDAVFVLNGLFRGGDATTCDDAADSNDDGTVNLTDPVFLLQNLFQGGEEPPSPGIATCGVDPTEDDMVDCVYPAAC